MKVEIWDYFNFCTTDRDAGKSQPVGARREWFAFYAVTRVASDEIVLRLNYWHAENKAQNGRWVVTDSYNWHDRHRNRRRERPCVPLALGVQAIRALSGRIRMETPKEYKS